MLVLTRRPGERIWLLFPDGTRFPIENCGKIPVRFGIDAPKHVRVVREEILGKPQEQVPGTENQAAARRVQAAPGEGTPTSRLAQIVAGRSRGDAA